MNGRTIIVAGGFALFALTMTGSWALGRRSYKKKVVAQAQKVKSAKANSKIVSTSYPVTENKRFVILTMSYNNAKFYQKNLDSILAQDYSNYRVIYVDDCSKDGTYEKVMTYLNEHEATEKFTVIRNEKNRGALENLYRTTMSAEDDEIAVILDGDDWFPHPHVLSNLNQYYADPDVWLTYGQFLFYPSYQSGDIINCAINSDLIRKKGNRNIDTLPTHLRTFYVGLFRNVKLHDLLYQGKFFDMAYDVAMMMPMLDMAQEHVYFNPNISYIYNAVNPISDVKRQPERQRFYDLHIRGFPQYEKLSVHPVNVRQNKISQTADLIILSYDRPMQLYACLESMVQFVDGLNQVFVLYRTSSKEYSDAYDEVKSSFPDVTFVQQPQARVRKSFKPLLEDLAFNPDRSEATYIAFSTDDIIFKGEININEGISALEETGAYGFHYRLGKHVDHCQTEGKYQGVPELIPIRDDIYAWQFSAGELDWKYPNTVDMTLYRKEQIQKDISSLRYSNPNTLEGKWSKRANYRVAGLMHSESRAINIPLNVVNGGTPNMGIEADELLKKFQEGWRIDYSPLISIQNRSAHYEWQPEYKMKAQVVNE